MSGVRDRACAAPYADSLSRASGSSGRRQAQRAAHRMIDRARRRGQHGLAGWLDARFRDGTLTTDGAGGNTESLAHTLAVSRMVAFLDSSFSGDAPDYGRAVMAWDRIEPMGKDCGCLIGNVDLRTPEREEIAGEVLAACFGHGDGATWYRLRYLGLDELSPDPGDAACATLDAWDSAPPRRRVSRQPDGPATYRVRFGWVCRNGDVHLARLELAVRAGPPALQVGEPTVYEVADSRLGADRWDRLLIDAFAANRLLGYLVRRRGV